MVRFILRRLVESVLVVLAVVLLTFIVVRVLPGNPLTTWLGPHPTAEQLEIARKHLGLDQPLLKQTELFFKNLLRGDLGVSLRTGQPVSVEIQRRFAATLELTTVAMLLSFLLGVPVGVLAARYPRHWLARMERWLSLFGIAIPIFWLGMLLQMVLAGSLNILPLQGRSVLPPPAHSITGLLLIDTLFNGEWRKFHDALQHIVMPSLTLAMASFGIITRNVRVSMAEVLRRPFIQNARAVGIPENRIFFRYALKNALIPVITVAGLVYGYLLGGTFLVEQVFDWPGVGQLAVYSILTNDMPVVTGVALLYAVIYTGINFLLDIGYRIIDPRLRG